MCYEEEGEKDSGRCRVSGAWMRTCASGTLVPVSGSLPAGPSVRRTDSHFTKLPKYEPPPATVRIARRAILRRMRPNGRLDKQARR